MIKLKLPKPTVLPGTPSASAADPAAPSPSTTGPTKGPIKLKLTTSQPPTPSEQYSAGIPSQTPNALAQSRKNSTISIATPKGRPKKNPAARPPLDDGSTITVGKKGKKRPAEDEITSPAIKRAASGLGGRRLSLKPPTPASANGKPVAKIALKTRKPSLPKVVDIRARQRAPPRAKGVGYDSEDSDVEKDPAIQQALILRMQPGEDTEYLRNAIASGQIGPHPSQGDAEVSLKFVEKDLRRAVVKVRGRMYAAVLAEMPCIVESMKSFDRKGWWKVADINQMLLVLGRCTSEDEARRFPLPREVDERSGMQYAHGLTPPMHWVRKRRFRKRLSYNQIANVEEEVERLLAEDKAWEDQGGTVTDRTLDRAELDRAQDTPFGNDEEDEDGDYDEDDYADADGEPIETVEDPNGLIYDSPTYVSDHDPDQGDPDLEAEMQKMFDADAYDDDVDDAPSVIIPASASTVPAATLANQPGPPAQSSPSPTPSASASDSESDESDADSPDVIDEDAAAKAAERAQQMEEVADLEREIERAQQKVGAMTNQLLQHREKQKLAALTEDLKVKKGFLGLLDGED